MENVLSSGLYKAHAAHKGFVAGRHKDRGAVRPDGLEDVVLHFRGTDAARGYFLDAAHSVRPVKHGLTY